MMENLLAVLKNQIDLFSHGAIESCTAGVHNTFFDSLGKALAQQNAVYNAMAQMGWYPASAATAAQIGKVKKKYAAACGK